MIKGKDIFLSPIEPEDISKLLMWINDRETVHFNTYYLPVSKSEQKNWYANIIRSGDVKIFGIRKNTGKKLIGTCQLCNINMIDRNAELRIRIGEQNERGKSYGTQASGLLLDFGFNDLNLEKIYLHVFSVNKRAISSYKKLGFAEEGRMKRHAYINGKYLDIIIMSRFRK